MGICLVRAHVALVLVVLHVFAASLDLNRTVVGNSKELLHLPDRKVSVLGALSSQVQEKTA